MATVKGDVHDIGKNIVGVVLQCNNYEVIDLGVMVPAAKILETAQEEKADIIGLSGLITPSLDEMCHVAAEMERQGFDLPLLIGGATTSRVHTAVKIHPNYRRGQTVYVTDASRAVGVAQSLMSAQAAARLRRRHPRRNMPASPRRMRAARSNKQRLSLADARANALKLELVGQLRAAAAELPRHAACSNDYPIAELVDYIDWTPFFATWELTGKFPAILDDAKSARPRAACSRMRRRCCGGSSTRAGSRPSAVVGFWPANADGDDILVFADETRSDADRDAAHAAPAARAARGPRQCRARRFRRAAGERPCRLHRRLRGHGRHRRGRGRRALQARQ